MMFAIANQDTQEVLSEHNNLDEVKEVYLPYFNKCRREGQVPENWVFRQKKNGELLDLSEKEQHEIRVFFLTQPRS